MDLSLTALIVIAVLAALAVVVIFIGVFVVFGGISDGVTKDYSRQIAAELGFRIGPGGTFNSLHGEINGYAVRLTPQPDTGALAVAQGRTPFVDHDLTLKRTGLTPGGPLEERYTITAYPPELAAVVTESALAERVAAAPFAAIEVEHRLDGPGAWATFEAPLHAYTPEDIRAALDVLTALLTSVETWEAPD